MNYTSKILFTQFVTHDVKSFIIEKPKGYKFAPGQATYVLINKPGWEGQRRPFTFTSLNEDPVLQFTIKSYPEHNGVTEQIGKMNPGDEFIIEEPWGAINYKGPGVFIAGGAGITPFVAIFRSLEKDGILEGNSLIFSNKTYDDIIYEREFRYMFRNTPGNLAFVLTREDKEGYYNKRIDKDYMRFMVKDFNQHFYICGPKQFVRDMEGILADLGVESDSIVFEWKK